MRASTTETIVIEGRTAEIDVTAPGPMKMSLLSVTVPERALHTESGDQLGSSLSMSEVEETVVALVTATTDLPESLVREIPASTVTELAMAADKVISEEYNEDEEEPEDLTDESGLDDFMADTSNDNVAAKAVEAEQRLNDAGSSGSSSESFDALTDVSGVGPDYADDLRRDGFYDIEDLQAATQQQIADVVGNALAARIKADVGGYNV